MHVLGERRFSGNRTTLGRELWSKGCDREAMVPLKDSALCKLDPEEILKDTLDLVSFLLLW